MLLASLQNLSPCPFSRPPLNASRGNRLQCSLIIKSLDSRHVNEALSYTWGEPDDFSFMIWVNGIQIPVRQNLLLALRVLRSKEDRLL